MSFLCDTDNELIVWTVILIKNSFTRQIKTSTDSLTIKQCEVYENEYRAEVGGVSQTCLVVQIYMYIGVRYVVLAACL